MAKFIDKTDSIVVPLMPKGPENRKAACGRAAGAAVGHSGPSGLAGSPDDPRMQEAMRLMQAFLAIEDAAGRTALITLAERLVGFDWVGKARQG